MSDAAIDWPVGTRVLLAPDGRTWMLGEVTGGALPGLSPGVVIGLDGGETCYASMDELWKWPAGPNAPQLCRGTDCGPF